MAQTRIIFFGTSDFAVPILKALCNKGFDITVITTPDKPSGRKHVPSPSSVKLAAHKLGLKILQPKDSGMMHSAFCTLQNFDIGIVAAYGKILPKSILKLPEHGIINVHPSILPKYRGPSPIHYALINGDKKTGVTIIELDEKIDHGNIIAQQEYEIMGNITYKELEKQLAELGAKLLLKTLADYISGTIKPKPQDHSKASFTKLITKSDGNIDWNNSARGIYNRWRAFHKWPGIYTKFRGKLLKIIECSPAKTPCRSLPKGELYISKNRILAPCGQGCLEIQKLQLEGKREMSAKEFINGYGKFLPKFK